MAYRNKQAHLDYNRKYREINHEKILIKRREYKLLLKLEVLNHYGKECKRCTYNDIRALQIDHVNDDGATERASLGGKSFSGWRFYEHLKKQNFPEGYQTLCANCNNIKQWLKTHMD